MIGDKRTNLRMKERGKMSGKYVRSGTKLTSRSASINKRIRLRAANAWEKEE